MGKKLYVGNLGYSTTDADLQQLFGASGTVQSAQASWIATRIEARVLGSWR